MKIEVLGTGCAKCALLAENVTAAVEGLGLAADVGKVTDIMEITKRGVMMTPALVVDGEVKFTGQVPSVEDIQKILT